MTNQIERWMTPWTENVIVRAEIALKSDTRPSNKNELVVNISTHTIGKVKSLKKNILWVFIRMQVGDRYIWHPKLWNIRNVRGIEPS
jgi:hypothetical protein